MFNPEGVVKWAYFQKKKKKKCIIGHFLRKQPFYSGVRNHSGHFQGLSSNPTMHHNNECTTDVLSLVRIFIWSGDWISGDVEVKLTFDSDVPWCFQKGFPWTKEAFLNIRMQPFCFWQNNVFMDISYTSRAPKQYQNIKKRANALFNGG